MSGAANTARRHPARVDVRGEAARRAWLRSARVKGDHLARCGVCRPARPSLDCAEYVRRNRAEIDAWDALERAL